MTPVPLVREYLLGLQQRIMAAVAAADGKPALSDPWRKDPGETLQGSGVTMILEDAAVFERAGCGFSHVTGPKLPGSATHVLIKPFTARALAAKAETLLGQAA